ARARHRPHHDAVRQREAAQIIGTEQGRHDGLLFFGVERGGNAPRERIGLKFEGGGGGVQPSA
ncbi:hypothetical protein AAB986_38610, partial [Burkholderia contaminans]|uniref:hypothetical protein n=1 Tax=Burkholderia contaminans TaxID=488447 RepID=UPI00310D0580